MQASGVNADKYMVSIKMGYEMSIIVYAKDVYVHGVEEVDMYKIEDGNYTAYNMHAYSRSWRACFNSSFAATAGSPTTCMLLYRLVDFL